MTPAPRAPDSRTPSRLFGDQCVLITGGTGSFGNQVVLRLLEAGCREISFRPAPQELRSELIGRPAPAPASAPASATAPAPADKAPELEQ